MSECGYSFLFLCFKELWLFYVWAVSMVVIFGFILRPVIKDAITLLKKASEK